ncbi:MAG: hypothetical protein ACFCVD_25085 [Nodosilinea sp.]
MADGSLLLMYQIAVIVALNQLIGEADTSKISFNDQCQMCLVITLH